jgi:hypothetical protein
VAISGDNTAVCANEPGAVADYARVAAAVAKEIGRLALLA